MPSSRTQNAAIGRKYTSEEHALFNKKYSILAEVSVDKIHAFALKTYQPTTFREGIRNRDISRPPNSFMLFRKFAVAGLKRYGNGKSNLSKLAGIYWDRMETEHRNMWNERAKAEKASHKDAYPNYVFSPKRGEAKKAAKKQTSPPATSASAHITESRYLPDSHNDRAGAHSQSQSSLAYITSEESSYMDDQSDMSPSSSRSSTPEGEGELSSPGDIFSTSLPSIYQQEPAEEQQDVSEISQHLSHFSDEAPIRGRIVQSDCPDDPIFGKISFEVFYDYDVFRYPPSASKQRDQSKRDRDWENVRPRPTVRRARHRDQPYACAPARMHPAYSLIDKTPKEFSDWLRGSFS